MSIFDLRERFARAVLSWGGKVDPATYVATHPATAAQANTVSFSPDSSRGPFLGWGLQRSQTDDAPISRMVLSIEARRLTPTPVAFNALCHLGTFSGQGIDLSQWPAPLLVEQAQAVNLYEECIDPDDTCANIQYALVGFHTDLTSFGRVAKEAGEFRGWSVEVGPDVDVAAGAAQDRYTLTEFTHVAEYLQTVYENPDDCPLDILRIKLDDKEILSGERTGTVSIGVAGPVRLGIPASYLGVDCIPGMTFTVYEKISQANAARRDAYSFLGVARA